ncbi:MAG: hypothetical protein MJA84_13335, partial [Firmicutes bacterium]|nr:hypothetical protein [Bacillota bacterium]
REKLVRDEISRLEGAKAEGEQIGIEKEKRSTARKLIAMGLSISDIAKATGLDEEATLKLKKLLYIVKFSYYACCLFLSQSFISLFQRLFIP